MTASFFDIPAPSSVFWFYRCFFNSFNSSSDDQFIFFFLFGKNQLKVLHNTLIMKGAFTNITILTCKIVVNYFLKIVQLFTLFYFVLMTDNICWGSLLILKFTKGNHFLKERLNKLQNPFKGFKKRVCFRKIKPSISSYSYILEKMT